MFTTLLLILLIILFVFLHFFSPTADYSKANTENLRNFLSHNVSPLSLTHSPYSCNIFIFLSFSNAFFSLSLSLLFRNIILFLPSFPNSPFFASALLPLDCSRIPLCLDFAII